MLPCFPATAMLLLTSGQQAGEGLVTERIRDVAGLDVEASKQFFERLKQAILSGNRLAVSKMMRYPLKANISDHRCKSVASPEEFLQHYDEIINKSVVKAIRDQEFSKLFINSRGIMVGRGEFWINAKRDSNSKPGRMFVITVNN